MPFIRDVSANYHSDKPSKCYARRYTCMVHVRSYIALRLYRDTGLWTLRTAIYWSYTVSFLPIKCNDSLTITPLPAYSAVEKLTFIKFSKKTGFDISCKLSTLYFEMLSAEIFTQHANCACIVLVKELKLLYTLS